MLNNGRTIEISRVCTDGQPNACSALYGAARKAAFAMGYERVVTYILDSEPGTSLRATGFVCAAKSPKRAGWAIQRGTTARGFDLHHAEDRWRWEAARTDVAPAKITWPDTVDSNEPTLFDVTEQAV